MPSNVLSPKPSWRARANAVSRFGPVTPLVPARARTWHEPHLDTNSCLPLTTLSPRLLTPQPLSAAATPITQAPSASPRTDPLSIGADPNRSGGGSACHQRDLPHGAPGSAARPTGSPSRLPAAPGC